MAKLCNVQLSPRIADSAAFIGELSSSDNERMFSDFQETRGYAFQMARIDVPFWVRVVFYLWLGVFNLFVLSTFWARLADVFPAEPASRLFGFVGSGRIALNDGFSFPHPEENEVNGQTG